MSFKTSKSEKAGVGADKSQSDPPPGMSFRSKGTARSG